MHNAFVLQAAALWLHAVTRSSSWAMRNNWRLPQKNSPIF